MTPQSNVECTQSDILVGVAELMSPQSNVECTQSDTIASCADLMLLNHVECMCQHHRSSMAPLRGLPVTLLVFVCFSFVLSQRDCGNADPSNPNRC